MDVSIFKAVHFKRCIGEWIQASKFKIFCQAIRTKSVSLARPPNLKVQ